MTENLKKIPTLVRSAIKKIFRSDSARGRNLNKNIAMLLVLKGIDVGIRYLRFPMILRYLGNEFHGVWLTMGGIINWFSLFNIGLGTGLRNKLAESLSVKDYHLARTYVSSTYAIISIISVVMFLLLLGSVYSLNWPGIFSVDVAYENMLKDTLLIVFTFFTLRFVLKLIETILTADQRPAMAQMIHTIASVIFFVGVWLALKYEYKIGDLRIIGVLAIGTLILAQIVASIILFSSRYKHIRPSFKFVNWSVFKGLASLGVQFFIVQISVIIMFSTDNIIITQISGPAEVVPYNVAQKYFGILEIFFLMVLNPFWSAFTQAYVKGEFNWIRKSVRKLVKMWGLMVAGGLVMLVLSGWVYRLWIGDLVEVPVLLSVLMMIFIFIKSWVNIFVFMINGVGKIRLQLILSIVIDFLNIPLSIYFADNLNMGASGVILATIVCLAIGAIVYPIQYSRIINKTAKGIWDR